MQRWISILLLLSFVRLQIVCCCGLVGYCAQQIEKEVIAEHCLADCHASDCHDLEIACNLAECRTVECRTAESGTTEAICPCDDCLRCEHSSHHHVFLISHSYVGLAQDSGNPKAIVIQQFASAVVPVVGGQIAATADSCHPSIALGLGSRALLMLAQLRI